MKKLQDLLSYLKTPATLQKAGLKILPEKIYGAPVEGDPVWNGDLSADGFYPLEHVYRAQIDFDEAQGDIEVLLTLIYCWLQENDSHREQLPAETIEWTGEPFDDGTSDVSIRLWFQDVSHFKAVAAGAGNFVYQGLEYSKADSTPEQPTNVGQVTGAMK